MIVNVNESEGSVYGMHGVFRTQPTSAKKLGSTSNSFVLFDEPE